MCEVCWWCSNEHAAPAILNALFHATGVRITELPATKEKILSVLKNTSGNNS